MDSAAFKILRVIVSLHFFTVFESSLPVRAIEYDKMPLALLKGDGRYSYPVCLKQNNDGTLDYSQENNDNVKAFCPSLKTGTLRLVSDAGCLYENEHVVQECDIEPEPWITRITKENQISAYCGSSDKYILYSFGFKLCVQNPNDESSYDRSMKELLNICYDKTKHIIVFLHYRVLSPELTENPSLTHIPVLTEESKKEDYGFENLKTSFTNLHTKYELNKSSNEFEEVMLAPHQDIALRLWKKPFLHIVNFRFLYKHLELQWTTIGHFVRDLARQKLGNVRIRVGTLNESAETGIAGIWWKLITDISDTQAMAFVLHNVPEGASVPEEEKICQVSVCEKYGFKGIEVGGAYCCEPNTITDRFALRQYTPLDLNKEPVLKLPEIKCL